jgi:hypothetical protein
VQTSAAVTEAVTDVIPRPEAVGTRIIVSNRIERELREYAIRVPLSPLVQVHGT